jgi:hypothetical protein
VIEFSGSIRRRLRDPHGFSKFARAAAFDVVPAVNSERLNG